MKHLFFFLSFILFSCEDQYKHPDISNKLCKSSLVTGIGTGVNIKNAAPSCRYIKEVSRVNAKSGAAWIDVDGPIGKLPPFKAFCDMSTDGGGWTLVSKIKFTVKGPSKIEMTGDVSLAGLNIDPYSGAEMASGNTDVDEFTYPEYPNYFPIAYNGDALQTNIDNVKATAPGECFASMSREVIEALRVNCHKSLGASVKSARKKSVLMQLQDGVKTYVSSSKFFNPIQHKCETPSSVCTGKDLSGCDPNLITEVYENYNPSTGKVSGLKTASNGWEETCDEPRANGTESEFGDSVLPAGWMAGGGPGDSHSPSAFYDLSAVNVKSSGAIGVKANNESSLYSYCSSSKTCGYTLMYVK